MITYAYGGMRVAEKRRGRRGLTLIEVVMASGIFSVVALFTIYLYMTLVHSNSTTSMQVSATNLIRSTTEDVFTAARENLSDAFGLGQASAALRFFAALPGARLEGTQNDRLVYYNPPIGNDGKFGTSNTRAEIGTAEGRMKVTMYLRESTVPPPPATSGGAAVVWRDVGTGTGTRAGGFDLNRDGSVNDAGMTSVSTIGALRTLAGLEGLGIRQLPVDIEVAYFKPGDNNPAKNTPLFRTTRRIIVMDEATLTGLEMGMGLDGDAAGEGTEKPGGGSPEPLP